MLLQRSSLASVSLLGPSPSGRRSGSGLLYALQGIRFQLRRQPYQCHYRTNLRYSPQGLSSDAAERLCSVLRGRIPESLASKGPPKIVPQGLSPRSVDLGNHRSQLGLQPMNQRNMTLVALAVPRRPHAPGFEHMCNVDMQRGISLRIILSPDRSPN